MNLKLFLIVLIITLPRSHAASNSKLIEETKYIINMDTAECFAKLVLELFSHKRVIVYEDTKYPDREMSEVMTEITKSLMQSGKYYVTARTACQRNECTLFRNYAGTPQFLIYTNSSMQLNRIISCLCSVWTSSSLFVIIAPPAADASEILDVMEDNFIYKGLVATVVGEHLEYYLAPPRCPELYSYDHSFFYACFLTTSQMLQFQKHVDMFTDCKVRFGLQMAPPYAFLAGRKQARQLGVDAEEIYLGLELIIGITLLNRRFRAEAYNISNVHELGEYNTTTKERTGLMKELHENKVDVLMGALYIDLKEEYGMEASYPILAADIVAVVKKQMNRNLFSIFRVFKPEVWLMLLFVKLCFFCLIYVILWRKRESIMSVDTVLMYLFLALIGKDVHFRKNSLALTFLSWIWFCFFIRICFEALMIIVLLNKDQLNQIDGLYEICKNDYKIFVSNINYAYFKNGLKLPGCYIPHENFILVEQPLQHLLDSDMNFAAFMYDQTYVTSLFLYIDDYGEVPFHQVKEIISNVPLMYYFRRGDPLGEKFKRTGALVFQSGLVQYYVKAGDHFMNLALSAILFNKEKNMSLQMKHVEVIFRLYLVGVTVSLVTFIVEIVTAKVAKKNKKKRF